ncbi:annexin A10 [Centrocercus urophasianus]|uniref:annexin A10 n=1 Tax=Centrocercus urophasianus TaxID=9002 RepID=UPI001C646B72|nr:annexin A10 [Centrocercus urophasianus]
MEKSGAKAAEEEAAEEEAAEEEAAEEEAAEEEAAEEEAAEEEAAEEEAAEEEAAEEEAAEEEAAEEEAAEEEAAEEEAAEEEQTQGTILPAPNFNPVMDAQSLGGALQGISCEKDVLIDILTQRCNAQRLMIAAAYRDMYGRDLMADLKDNLSHHFKEVMVGLMYPPASYDAHELWHALKGVNTEEKCLIDILASRSNMEIFQMKEAYLTQYNSDLQQDIDSETSGHFRDTLMNLAQGTRMEGYADPATAAQDAMILWEACQQRTGEHKNMLQMILCNRSYQQLWMVFQEFQSISGQDLVDAINDCYDGYFQELLVAIVLCVRDKPSYFAYRLHHAIHDFGFHNKTVIRILIARSEIDLMTIRQRYKERYGKSLFHDIKHFASGHYESALLAICAGDVEDY